MFQAKFMITAKSTLIRVRPILPNKSQNDDVESNFSSFTAFYDLLQGNFQLKSVVYVHIN